MTKRFLLGLLLLLITGVQALAQSEVSGKVFDEAGAVLSGVYVQVKGTTTGTMTDQDGNWHLKNVKPNSVLVFSCLSYKTQEVGVASRSVFNVVLANDTMFLDDVVVIGYGTTKRKDLTGSITQIDNRLIAAQNASSVTRALEGAIPGLVYATVDGQPGNDAGLRVRGLGSTNAGSSDALIVIDGVPSSGENPLSNLNQEDIATVTVLKDAASSAIYGTRGANGVVLVTTKSGSSGKTKVKMQSRFGWNTVGTYHLGQLDDAASHYEYVWRSIYNSYRYGVKGTGGPVLDPATLEYTTNIATPNYSHEEAARFASEHLFNYVGKEKEFARNVLGNYMAYNVPGAEYIPDGLAATHSSTMQNAYLVNTDGKINPNAVLLYNDTYADAILRAGFRQQYDISASGGNDIEDHYVSIGYMKDPSYIPNSKFDRISGRAKLNANLFKWLRVGTNVSFVQSKTNYMGTYWGRRNSGTNPGSIPRFVNGHSPIIPFHAHDAQGDFIYDANGEKVRSFLTNSTYSPLGETDKNYGGIDILYAIQNDKREDLTSTLNTRSYAEIPFLNHFTARIDFAYDKINNMQTFYYNGITGRAKGMGGYFGKKSFDTATWNMQQRLAYNQDIGKHHVDAMLLHEFSDWEQQVVGWGSYDEFIPGLLASANFVGRYGGAGSAPTPGFWHDIERMDSYIGRANYIYGDKYYFSASIRRDGSSKFRKENRWGNFWSVGGGWRFSEESFMEPAKGWLDNGKLRVSYGKLGNQNGIGRYQTYRTWGYSTVYKQVTNGTGQPTGSDYKLSMGKLVNTALTWEETLSFDLGLDLTILSRIDITLDYYRRTTRNSQFNQPVSELAYGQSSLPMNIAGLTNQGIELDVNADIIRTKDWRWNLAVNATHYTTKLTSLPASAIPAHVKGLPDGTWEAYDGGAWSAAGGLQQTKPVYLRGLGKDWYNLYIYRYAGVDEKTGLPMYWRKVDEEDIAAGRYKGYKVGDDVKTTNYARASKYEVGSPLPLFAGGFNTSLSYKSWNLSAQFAYQVGGKFFSRNHAEYLYNNVDAQSYRMMTISKEVKDNTWTPENQGARFPMQWYPVGSNKYFTGTSTNGGNWNFTDLSLFDASYLRMKNITLSYTATKSLLRKLQIGALSSVRLFASVDNLFLLSATRGLDPSMSVSGGYNDVDTYTFPHMRTYTIGINLDF